MILPNSVARCSGNRMNKQLDIQYTDCIRLSNYADTTHEYWQSWTLQPIKTFDEVCLIKVKL